MIIDETRRVDPWVWLAPLGFALALLAVISAAAARNLSPGFVVCGLAAIVCLGFGLGAVADEIQRRHPVGFSQGLYVFAWLCTGGFLLSMARRHFR